MATAVSSNRPKIVSKSATPRSLHLLNAGRKLLSLQLQFATVIVSSYWQHAGVCPLPNASEQLPRATLDTTVLTGRAPVLSFWAAWTVITTLRELMPAIVAALLSKSIGSATAAPVSSYTVKIGFAAVAPF